FNLQRLARVVVLVPVRAGTGSNQGIPAGRPGKVPQTWGSRGAISTPAGKKIRFFSFPWQMAVPGLRVRLQLPLQDLAPAGRGPLARAEVETGVGRAALPALHPPGTQQPCGQEAPRGGQDQEQAEAVGQEAGKYQEQSAQGQQEA